MSVYAVSDLHGRYDVFLRGIERIGLESSDKLYVIGDAIDRGPDGIKILKHVMERDNMDLLIGNHEFMMLNSVNALGERHCDGRDSDLWLYYNGGRTTHAQYKRLFPKDRRELLAWLHGRALILPLEIGGRRFCLTHSHYLPACENLTYDELNYPTVWDIVWKSMFRTDRETHCDNVYKDFDCTFITGHVPVQRIYKSLPIDRGSWAGELKYAMAGNLIDIDGGCGLGYVSDLQTGAIFLRLDDMEEFPVLMGPE